MTAPGLKAAAGPLTATYDTAIVDLDGVVYLAAEPVPHAADAIEAARRAGMTVLFVTNNSSRSPASVAEHLSHVGVRATPDDVVTSAQAVAGMLREQLPAGVPVLVVGGAGLREEVGAAGYTVVDSADADPRAVVQGYAPDVGYRQLAEAALAIRAGARWIASNRDPTLPSPRGLLPGNGALVTALQVATGRQPEFAGKPDPPLTLDAVRRAGAHHPLVVGDRLDTDIEGAVNTGLDSLLVLTGVTQPADLLTAPPGCRPTYLSTDLRGLLQAHPSVDIDGRTARCGPWHATAVDGRVQLTAPDGTAAPVDALRAACAAAWGAADAGQPVAGFADDPVTERAVRAARAP